MKRWMVWALLAIGCQAGVRKCADQTVLVSVTLEGAAANADELVVSVAIGTDAPVPKSLPHEPGRAMGSIQIEFSHYPRGQSVVVTIQAKAAGATLATAMTTVPINADCIAIPLTVGVAAMSGDGPLDDLLNPADLARMLPDLAGIDLVGCMPAQEDCFNHSDDDCDGLVDCDDPDCSGGANPKVACVPDPGSFTAGSVAGFTCPTAWPTKLTILSNMVSGCSDGTCGCSAPGTPKCAVEMLYYDAADTGCATPLGVGGMGYTDGTCATIEIPAGDYHELSSPSWVGDCGTPTGVATKQAGFAASEAFCSGGTLGGGCLPSEICVPAAPNHCVMAIGSQLTCPDHYVRRSTRYYTGFDDMNRFCNCTCPVTTPGDCTGTPAATVFATGDCTSLGAPAPVACDVTDTSLIHSGNITGVTAGAATCGPSGIDESGTVDLQNEQTVCCVP